MLTEVPSRVDWREQAPAYLGGAAAVMSVISIAAFENLLWMALVSLLLTKRLRRPPLVWPMLAWIAWTLVSWAAQGAAHGHTRAGFPQIKKLYLFLMLVVVYSALRSLIQVRAVVIGWTVAASLSAAWSMEQFARKYHAAQVAHENFYQAYVGARITGFMDHWMTFSGQMMMALMLIGAVLLFSREGQKKWLLPAAALVGAALLAADTRSMWGGATAGAIYLLWMRKRWLVAAIPVMAGLIFLTNLFDARERIISIVHPHGDTDSNEHRALLRRVGWEMIKAHPILGLGPERVGPEFEHYVPADVPRPLPTGYYGHLHNIYFHYAAERGLPALAALLWFLGSAIYDFARALRRLPQSAEARWVLHGAIAVIIAVMLGGYFEVNLGDSEVQAMFLAVIACGYVVRSA